MVEKVTVPHSQAAPIAPAPAAAPAGPNVVVKTMPGARPAGEFGMPGAGPQRVEIESRPAAALTEKVDAAGAALTAQVDGARPEWLPSKFKTPAELAQAYAQLEQRLGGAPAAEPVAAESAPPAASPDHSALIQKLTQEWASTGQVSAASRAEFTQRTGLPATYIDSQVSYLQAQNAKVGELAAKRLGGEQAVSELVEWAKHRLSPEDRQAFNQAVYSGNPALATMALDGLAAKYEMEVGRAPRVIAGRKPQQNAGGIQPFQSNAEWTAARRDPRYKIDEAYRQLVTDRLVVSQRLGLI